MPDSTRTVEILLDVKANKAELAAVSAEMEALKASTTGTAVATQTLGVNAAQAANATQVFTRAAQPAAQQAIFLGAGATQAAVAAAGANATFLPAAAAATNLGAAAAGAGNAARTSTSGILMLTRGVDDLGMAFGVGRLGRAGFMVRGVEDITFALQKMSPSAISLFAVIGVGAAAFAAFTGAMGAVVTKGLELQKTLQDVKEGVEGTLTTDSTKFGGGKAQEAGTAAIDTILQKAKEAEVPVSQLAKAFDLMNPAATRANASIKEQIDLVAMLVANHGALHISEDRLITDLNQLFNGQTRNANALAQRLGIEKSQVLAARENGTITDLLIQKTQERSEEHTSELQSPDH